ncbi:hypothetical protein ACLOJK_020102 [Asimina triloba]
MNRSKKPLLTLQSLMQIPSLKGIKVREIASSSSSSSAAEYCTLFSTISTILHEEQTPLEPFYIMDLGQVVSLHHSWLQNLPSITPFFPVRCNPDPVLLATLAALGAGFDCGSRDEIERVTALSVPPDRILFSNPCKAEDHIKHAARLGVNLLVFDSTEELDKVRRCHPHCTLLLHVHVPSPPLQQQPACSSKSGALPHEVVPLLRHAQQLRLHVAGVSLEQEGSGSRPKAIGPAVEAACNAFQALSQTAAGKPRILNLGGGFALPKEAVAIRQLLQSKLPDDVRVIACPGRFLAETTSVLVTNVIGKRRRGAVVEYWVNDGVYGSMNGMVYHGQKGLEAVPFAYASQRENPSCRGLPTFPSTVFGPTCDALDTVFTDRQLPELSVGDWLLFLNMGAYTHASATNFNGFFAASICTRYIFTRPSCSPNTG